jgi:hypothetical protein
MAGRPLAAAKEDEMTKQLLKGLWAASLVTVLAVLSVPAEAAEIRCRIPFSFTINGKTLPAGTYRVSSEAVQGALLVRGFGQGAVVLTNSIASRKDTEAKLVFHKYGDQYILRQAWMGGGSGRELPESRLEQTLAKAAQDRKVATSFERVVIPVL